VTDRVIRLAIYVDRDSALTDLGLTLEGDASDPAKSHES
jgi:hypothetical protein